jgi:ArsR family transcriptional regulator
MKEASSEARKATRFATSSEVPRRPWAGCVSGALEKDEYERLLSEASFQEVSVEVTQTYDEEFEIVEENGVRKDGAEELRVERLVALGRALSDPTRVRMLSMMADGRGCCDFSGSGVPADEGDEGICVCELEEHFSMGQSKVSYHMKKLKDAGLVSEERRGRWAFYSLDRDAAEKLLGEAAERLLSGAERRSAVGGSASGMFGC